MIFPDNGCFLYQRKKKNPTQQATTEANTNVFKPRKETREMVGSSTMFGNEKKEDNSKMNQN